MAQWIQDTAGGYTLIGGGRTAAIPSDELPAEKAIKLQLAPPDLNHSVFVLAPCSADGRSGYEVGVVGTNIIIRSVRWADPALVVMRDSAAHGLTNGIPFSLEVRVIAGVIEVRLNGDTGTPISSFDTNTVTPALFDGFKHFGWVSNVDGARVIRVELCDLLPVVVNRADVLVAVCGGDVWASVDGTDIFLVRAGSFNATGEVCLVEFEGQMYGFDGAHARIINPITFDVTAYTPSQGTLPGYDGSTPGSCRVSIACSLGGRLWFNDLDNPQNLVACAINDAADLDTGSDSYGKAFGLTAADIGKIGQPITALFSSTRGTLGIGCNNSIWELLGDPALGVPQLRCMLRGSGISGKDAVTTVAEGRSLCHTPEGPYLVPAVGEPIALAAVVLTDGINIPREDIHDYLVQVRRDPVRHMVHFFLTPKVGDGDCLHFAYDERVGGYTPESGGWFPDDMVERLGPTASTPEPWLGKVIMGTRDGYLMHFDNDTRNDDGEIVTVRVPVTLIQQQKILRETILHRFSCLPGNNAAVKYRLWGAARPEEVYGASPTSLRYELQSGQFSRIRTAVDRKSRAPALMLELYNDQLTGQFEVEQVDAVISAGRLLTRKQLSAIVIPEACVPSIINDTLSSFPASFSSGPGFSTAPTSLATSLPTSLSSSDPPISVSSASMTSIVTGINDTSSSSASITSLSTELPPHCTIVTDIADVRRTICLTGEPNTILVPESDLGGGEEPPLSSSSVSTSSGVGGDWTEIPEPSGSAQLIYVATSGDDANAGTQAAPIRTLAEAYSRCRDGFPDRVYLNRGDTWNTGFPNWSKSGDTTTFSEYMMILSYGTGPRPKIRAGPATDVIYASSSTVTRRGLAIFDLDIAPSSTPATSAAAFTFLGRWGYVLVENCKVIGMAHGMVIQELVVTERMPYFSIRRNVIADIEKDASGHTQGIFMGSCDNWLVEENVLDNNARLKADQFCHNAYIHESNGPGIFRGNVSARACSHGVQQRPGGELDDNLFLQNCINVYQGKCDSSYGGTPAATNYMRRNVILDARDINAIDTRGIGVSAGGADNLICQRNIIAHQVSGTDAITAFDFSGVNAATIEDNVVYDWIYPGSAVCWPACVTWAGAGTGAIEVTGNKFYQRSNNGSIIRHETMVFAARFNYHDNDYYSASTGGCDASYPKFLTGTGYGGDFAGWQAAVTDTGSTYGLPFAKDVTIAAYQTSIGDPGTLVDFMTAARLQERGSYDERYTAYAVGSWARTIMGI